MIQKISAEAYQVGDSETRAFSSCDPATWPVLLTDEQVAAIFQIALATLRKKAARGAFVPAPIAGVKPRRYRRVDVLRFVEGARGSSMRRVG